MYYHFYLINQDPNCTNVMEVLYVLKHIYQKLLDLICSFYYFHDSNNQFILYLFPLNLSFLINLYSILHYQNMHITQQLYYLNYQLNLDHEINILVFIYYVLLKSQLKYFHYHLSIPFLCNTIQVVLTFTIQQCRIQFKYFYYIQFLNESIFLVQIIHFTLTSLQQYYHLYLIVMDYV